MQRHRLPLWVSTAVVLAIFAVTVETVAAENRRPAPEAGTTNFPQDFQAAMKLYYDGKLAEAERAFLDLGQRSRTPRGADECLARAAVCAFGQKAPDRAMELAERIKDDCQNRACRMNLLRQLGKPDEVLALGGNQDLENWPDRLIFDAALCRGRAFATKREIAKAKNDFLLAVSSTLDADEKALAWQSLGDLYRGPGNDPQKAIAAYGEVLKLKARFRRLAPAAIARARLLAASGKWEQAIAELDDLLRACESFRKTEKPKKPDCELGV